MVSPASGDLSYTCGDTFILYNSTFHINFTYAYSKYTQLVAILLLVGKYLIQVML